MTLSRRIKNTMRRMCEGEDFYTNANPRITNAEITEIEKVLDLTLQRDHTFGASAGPIAIYPLDREEFKKRVEQMLENEEA